MFWLRNKINNLVHYSLSVKQKNKITKMCNINFKKNIVYDRYFVRLIIYTSK